MDAKSALEQLAKEEKRKFTQSVDVIVNLKGVDLKRDNVNVVATLPHKFKDKRVCGFLESKSSLVATITKTDFPKYKEKKSLKNLIKQYDFFIAAAPLMPVVATTFGKVLGPAGKMPSPQLGMLQKESPEAIQHELEKIAKSIKIRVKEASVKVSVGNEKMKPEELMENMKAVLHSIVEALPKKKDNVKNVMLKLTMSKPLKVEMI